MTALHQRAVHTGDDLRYPRAAAFAAVCVVLAGGGHVLASSASHPAVPPWWTWVAGFLLVLAAALPFAGEGRSRSLPGIAGLLFVCQLALHTLFALGPQAMAAAGGSPGAASGPGGSDAAVVERASEIVCGAPLLSAEQARQILIDAGLQSDLQEFARLSDTGGAGHVHQHVVTGGLVSVLPSLSMLLGHALAGIAAGWLLRRGDLALLRLVRLAGQDLAAEPAVLRPLRGALALVRALSAGLPGAPGRLPVPSGAAFGDVPVPPTAPLQHTVIRRGPPAPDRTLALAA